MRQRLEQPGRLPCHTGVGDMRDYGDIQIIDMIGDGHAPHQHKWREAIWCSQSFLRQPADIPLRTGGAVWQTRNQLSKLAAVYGNHDGVLLLDAERWWPWDHRAFLRGESWFRAVDSLAHKLFPDAEIRWYSGQNPELWPAWADLAVPCYMSSAAKRSYNRAVAQATYGPMTRAMDSRGRVFLPLVMPHPSDKGPGDAWEPDVFRGFLDGLWSLGFGYVGLFGGPDAFISHANGETRNMKGGG